MELKIHDARRTEDVERYRRAYHQDHSGPDSDGFAYHARLWHLQPPVTKDKMFMRPSRTSLFSLADNESSQAMIDWLQCQETQPAAIWQPRAPDTDESYD